MGVAIVAPAVVLIPGAPLLSITLYANLLAVVLMPAALVFLIVLADERELMGIQSIRAVVDPSSTRRQPDQ